MLALPILSGQTHPHILRETPYHTLLSNHEHHGLIGDREYGLRGIRG